MRYELQRYFRGLGLPDDIIRYILELAGLLTWKDLVPRPSGLLVRGPSGYKEPWLDTIERIATYHPIDQIPHKPGMIECQSGHPYWRWINMAWFSC